MASADHQSPEVPPDARDRLDAERRRLEGLLASLPDRRDEATAGGELSMVDQHPADLGTETFDTERDESIADSLRAELDEVGAALSRLDDGSYGRCVVCGRAIGAERLTALPATPYCVDDAAAAEAAAERGPVAE